MRRWSSNESLCLFFIHVCCFIIIFPYWIDSLDFLPSPNYIYFKNFCTKYEHNVHKKKKCWYVKSSTGKKEKKSSDITSPETAPKNFFFIFFMYLVDGCICPKAAENIWNVCKCGKRYNGFVRFSDTHSKWDKKQKRKKNPDREVLRR